MGRILLIFGAVGAAWLIGLSIFIANLPREETAPLAKSDGVIVFTGGGGARIAAGMALMAAGAGDRLLISGVHQDTSRERLSQWWTGSSDLFDCCVDVGRNARSTIGNAMEAADWAAEHQYADFILVTSDYHMPRALAELRVRMPDAQVTPYPVASGYLDADGRPTSRQSWRRIAGEYNKYLAARAKGAFTGARPPAGAPAA